jgi:hypothetical protein
MHYIRFLKPPKIQGNKICTLITITTDLGDDFCCQDVSLSATLRRSTDSLSLLESAGVTEFTWLAGMRSLPITIHIPKGFSLWPAIVFVQHLDPNKSGNCGFDKLPLIHAAASTELDPPRGIMMSERVVARFLPSTSQGNFNVFFEETGESIARHLWYGFSLRISCKSISLRDCWYG